MPKELKEIEKMLAEINKNAESIRKKKIKVKDSELPGNVRLMLTGLNSSKTLDFIFSSRLDVLLDKLMDLITTGELMSNVEKFFSNEEDIKKLFSSMGFGEGSFEGPVSRTILSSIKDSMDNPKYLAMKSEVDKVKYVYKKLNMKWWSFWNKPVERKKFEKAMDAIKQILTIIGQVYKNRLKIIEGLGNIVTESVQQPIEIEKII
jgi:hypothetical protein